MLTGLDGKVMTYDGENRPLSVSLAGTTTTYAYAADGTRLKKTVTTGGTSKVTAYFGGVEIRNYGQGTAEEILTYPHASVSLKNGVPSFLHKDQLGSIRGVTGPDGLRDERVVYRPFGEPVEFDHDGTATNETKRFVGERYDADAGLQYLNARYYDPQLGLFIQPDWFEVMKQGVGTNRYAYSFNDPVNKRDPGGNAWYDDWDDFKDVFRSNDHIDESGRRVIESAPVLRATVPGQIAWDNARTYAANGEHSNAAISTVAMGAEIGLLVTGGTVLKSGASLAVTEVKALGSTTKAATTEVATVAAEGSATAIGAKTVAVSSNKITHTFGNETHLLDDFLKKFGGDQAAAYNAVKAAAEARLQAGTLQAGANGVMPSAGAVLEVNGSLIQLSGGRIINGNVFIGSFSTVIRLK